MALLQDDNQQPIDNGQIVDLSITPLNNIFFVWDYLDNTYYTIILYDVTAENYIHYMVINIPGMDIDKGQEIESYKSPQNTSKHNYIFTIYRQPGYKHMSNVDSLDSFLKDFLVTGTVSFYAGYSPRRISWSSPLEIPGNILNYDQLVDTYLKEYAIIKNVNIPYPYDRQLLLDNLYTKVQ